MSAEAIIKSQARNILKHNFVKAIVALLIVALPFTMIDGTTTVISSFVINSIADEQTAGILVYAIGYPVEFILGFLLSPVINGYIRAYYKAAYTNTIDLRDVFFYFNSSHYSDALSLNIRYIIRMLLPILLSFTPLILFEVISNQLASGFHGSVLYQNVCFILTILSSLIVTLYATRYFTVFTVSADNPHFTPQQVFAYNKHIMRWQSGNVVKLIFSFTPWLLLCMLILPMLYVIPYMTMSLSLSAKWMTKAAIEVN